MAEPRRELADLPPAVHGGDAPPGVVDFSTGVSPLPPPPSVMAAWRAADVTRYPHPTALPLREAIAARHAVAVDEVVVGAGSVELIWALARAFGGAGRRVGFVAPAFAEYAQAARASGAEVAAVDVDDACDLLFVARPGNPTLVVPCIESRARRARRRRRSVSAALLTACRRWRRTDRVAVLRSLTKVFALPGLRLGYLVASRVGRARGAGGAAAVERVAAGGCRRPGRARRADRAGPRRRRRAARAHDRAAGRGRRRAGRRRRHLRRRRRGRRAPPLPPPCWRAACACATAPASACRVSCASACAATTIKRSSSPPGARK